MEFPREGVRRSKYSELWKPAPVFNIWLNILRGELGTSGSKVNLLPSLGTAERFSAIPVFRPLLMRRVGLPDLILPFKRPIYERVVKEFAHLARS